MQSIVLVTGGSGLVGNAIKEISDLYPQYLFVYPGSKDYNLCDYNSTCQMFAKYMPDYVIHLAANVGGLFKNMKENVNMYEINLQINYNVVKCSHEFKVKKFIGCLSTCIFPDNTNYPIDENMIHNGPPHDSNFGYAYAKRMLEIQCRTYREQYGDNMVCIIPTNIYGKHDNFNLENAHVIPALIHKCYLAKKEGNNLNIKGTGTALRQFIYSEDLAKLILIILQQYDKNDNIILSVGESEEVTIANIVKIICDKLDYHNVSFDGNENGNGQHKKTASNKKLTNFLISNNTEFNFTNLHDGLDKTIDWFIENYNLIRK